MLPNQIKVYNLKEDGTVMTIYISHAKIADSLHLTYMINICHILQI